MGLLSWKIFYTIGMVKTIVSVVEGIILDIIRTK